MEHEAASPSSGAATGSFWREERNCVYVGRGGGLAGLVVLGVDGVCGGGWGGAQQESWRPGILVGVVVVVVSGNGICFEITGWVIICGFVSEGKDLLSRREWALYI